MENIAHPPVPETTPFNDLDPSDACSVEFDIVIDAPPPDSDVSGEAREPVSKSSKIPGGGMGVGVSVGGLGVLVGGIGVAVTGDMAVWVDVGVFFVGVGAAVDVQAARPIIKMPRKIQPIQRIARMFSPFSGSDKFTWFSNHFIKQDAFSSTIIYARPASAWK